MGRRPNARETDCGAWSSVTAASAGRCKWFAISPWVGTARAEGAASARPAGGMAVEEALSLGAAGARGGSSLPSCWASVAAEGHSIAWSWLCERSSRRGGRIGLRGVVDEPWVGSGVRGTRARGGGARSSGGLGCIERLIADDEGAIRSSGGAGVAARGSVTRAGLAGAAWAAVRWRGRLGRAELAVSRGRSGESVVLGGILGGICGATRPGDPARLLAGVRRAAFAAALTSCSTAPIQPTSRSASLAGEPFARHVANARSTGSMRRSYSRRS